MVGRKDNFPLWPSRFLAETLLYEKRQVKKRKTYPMICIPSVCMKDTWELSENGQATSLYSTFGQDVVVQGAPGHSIQPHLQHCPHRAASSSDVLLFLHSWVVAWPPVWTVLPSPSTTGKHLLLQDAGALAGLVMKPAPHPVLGGHIPLAPSQVGSLPFLLLC